MTPPLPWYQRPWFHPGPAALTRAVDGSAPPREARRTRRHLARCPRCAAEVQFARALAARTATPPAGADAPGLAPGSAHDALLARIHASRAARAAAARVPNAVRAAPRAPRPAPSRVPRRAVRVAWGTLAAAAALVLALVLRPTRDLSAGAPVGTLRFTPAAPRFGDTVRVAYEPALSLAAEPRLVLRARYRGAHDLPYNWYSRQRTAAVLARGDDGVFRGTFVLPDSAVYGAFAVEDTAARTVDANRRALWELFARGATGQPTAAALEQREGDLMGRNWELGYETARQAATLYPELPSAQRTLAFFEDMVLGSGGAAAGAMTAEQHKSSQRARLANLHARDSVRPEVSPDEMGAYVYWAQVLGDSARANYWRARLGREAPHSFYAIMEWTATLLPRAPGAPPPERALAVAESLWVAIGRTPHLTLIYAGLGAAEGTRDAAAFARWADRAEAAGFAYPEVTGPSEAALPGGRPDALRRLRGAVRTLAARDDGERDLDATRADAAREREVRRRRALVALGEALRADGRPRAALDTLELATTFGTWDPSLDRTVAGLHLALGDTAGALSLLARVAADPVTGPTFGDSAPTLARGRFDAAAWPRLVTDARTLMRTRVLDRAVRRALPNTIPLAAVGGGAAELHALARGRPTLVVFWSRFCGPSAAQLPELQKLAARLHTAGYGVVTITDEDDGPALRTFLRERAFTFPVYNDQGRAARRAFNQWGTPELYVLDAGGAVRFERTQLGQVAAQLAVLRP